MRYVHFHLVPHNSIMYQILGLAVRESASVCLSSWNMLYKKLFDLCLPFEKDAPYLYLFMFAVVFLLKSNDIFLTSPHGFKSARIMGLKKTAKELYALTSWSMNFKISSRETINIAVFRSLLDHVIIDFLMTIYDFLELLCKLQCIIIYCRWLNWWEKMRFFVSLHFIDFCLASTC